MRWGWSKALPTFPPSGVAECWMLLPKVARTPRARCEQSLLLRGGTHPLVGCWETPAHASQCLAPRKLLLRASGKRAEGMRAEQETRGKSVRTEFCPICYCSWQLFTNGSGHLAEKRRHWWHVSTGLLHIACFAGDIIPQPDGCSRAQLPNQRTWTRNQTLASHLRTGVSKVTRATETCSAFPGRFY